VARIFISHLSNHDAFARSVRDALGRQLDGMGHLEVAHHPLREVYVSSRGGPSMDAHS
jgi:hypothetical protein